MHTQRIIAERHRKGSSNAPLLMGMILGATSEVGNGLVTKRGPAPFVPRMQEARPLLVSFRLFRLSPGRGGPGTAREGEAGTEARGNKARLGMGDGRAAPQWVAGIFSTPCHPNYQHWKLLARSPVFVGVQAILIPRRSWHRGGEVLAVEVICAVGHP
jgi:hypothetical protein